MSPQQQRKLQVIRDVRMRLGELVELSKADGEEMLAYLIDLAQIEAQSVEAELERPRK